MVQRFTAFTCGGDQDRQIIFDLVLPDQVS
jgi:hypothetical protein